MLVRHTTPTRLRRACVDRRPGPLPPSLSPLLLEASTHTRRSILYWMKSTASDPPSICRTSPCPIHQRGPAPPPPRPAGCPPSLSSLGGRPKLRDPSGFTAQHRRPGLAPHHQELTVGGVVAAQAAMATPQSCAGPGNRRRPARTTSPHHNEGWPNPVG
jgi:hypothetical protein